MNFRDLLYEARAGKEWAVMELLTLYDPLLTKEAIIGHVLDEDLYQELRIVLLRCIHAFPI